MIEPFCSRVELETYQLDRLRYLLAAVTKSNPFYSAKLRPSGAYSQIASLADFRERAPFTTKRELVDDQQRHPLYGTNLTFPMESYSRFSQTNGTTGVPLRWLDTTESWAWMLGNWEHVYASAGVTASDRLFFAFSFGPFLGFWTAFETAARMGCLCIPGGGLHSSGRLRAIVDLGVTVLCCTPTYAIRLGEVAAEENLDLKGAKVTRIIVAGEPGGSIRSTQSRIEELWPGARVIDHHGMTEIGPVSYACPKRQRTLHVIESSYIAEVIDPLTGAVAGPGEQGELILTNLGRVGSPLIRYRTGDLVELGANERCECGTYNLTLEGGILARCDDMVVVRGINLYPSAIEDVLRGFAAITEYRVEVQCNRTLPELSILIEPAEGSMETSTLAHRVETALRDAFSLRIPVQLAAPGTLPRFEMKARRWVRL